MLALPKKDSDRQRCGPNQNMPMHQNSLYTYACVKYIHVLSYRFKRLGFGIAYCQMDTWSSHHRCRNIIEDYVRKQGTKYAGSPNAIHA